MEYVIHKWWVWILKEFNNTQAKQIGCPQIKTSNFTHWMVERKREN